MCVCSKLLLSYHVNGCIYVETMDMMIIIIKNDVISFINNNVKIYWSDN
jgi:hypothetical protein